jgi:hypothetical protein
VDRPALRQRSAARARSSSLSSSLVWALAWTLAACAHRPEAPPPPPGTMLSGQTFTAYSPLASSREIAGRLLTPLTVRRGAEVAQRSGLALVDQPIDLAAERFTVYLPGGPPPPAGFGLLVYIAPWDDPTEPDRWRPVFDRHGIIFVCATAAGNESHVYNRRLPLALLAFENVRARYPVDPERVYVGGLSGGSRVAEMAALGFPDLFRGALLNAGSDPIGDDGIHLPPAPLFHRFQRTRLVFVTGGHDEFNLRADQVSRNSLKDFCVFNVETKAAPRLAHEQLDASTFDRALEALEARAALDEEALRRCNQALEQRLAARLDAARAALGRGDRQAARGLVDALDAGFGGLAGPALLELDDQLQPQRP